MIAGTGRPKGHIKPYLVVLLSEGWIELGLTEL